jgi:hypothetical protein
VQGKALAGAVGCDVVGGKVGASLYSQANRQEQFSSSIRKAKTMAGVSFMRSLGWPALVLSLGKAYPIPWYISQLLATCPESISHL